MYQIIISARADTSDISKLILTFKGNERAMNALEAIGKAKADDNVLVQGDDYGFTAVIEGSDILHALLIDLEQAETCRFETNIHTAKTGKKLAARVNSNPEELELMRALNPPRPTAPRPPSGSIIQ